MEEFDEACSSTSEFDDLDIKQAVQFGELTKVKHLIESGLATSTDTDADDCSLLHWAAINNRLQVAQYLVDNKCDINHIGGVLACTPLHWATRQGHTRMVALLLKNGADFTIRDGEGFTVLHTACQYGRTPIACYLIAKGMSPDSRDTSQMTPIMYAAARSVTRDPIHMLVSMGANVNATDGIFGHSSLHFAVIYGNHSGIGTLLKLKADLSIVNKENETPLDIAHRKNDHLSIRLLEMAERQAGLRRYTWRQRLYEDQSFMTQIAYLVPFIFYFLPGIVLASKTDIILKTLTTTAIYGSCLAVLKNYIGNHVQTTASFTSSFVVASKMFYFVLWLIYLHQTAGWYLQIFFFAILVTLPYMYYILYNRDPGSINISHSEKCKQIIYMTEGDNFIGSFCSTCLIIRPIRSKHCRHCDKCINKFDHHCVWIGQCVGQNNHRLFLSYLLLLHLSTFVVILGCFFYYSDTCGEISFTTFAHCQPWVSYVLVMALILFVWLNCLIFMQFYGISNAMTANERINAHRYKHFQPTDDSTSVLSPFSKGCVKNTYSFFFDEQEEVPSKSGKFPIV